MANDRHGSGFFGGFVIGATIGAAVALALTREDARDMVVGKAKEASSFAKDASEDLRDKVSDVRDKVADAAAQWQANATDLYERGRHVVENARGNFGAAVEEGTANADHLRDELRYKTEE
ncbi:MAG TPA: YtxH domain-containing protein [Candidatus Dormibacteraeota bacterium]|jgi:gas vesicle protein|nr:YtxH domain-containing protein [Candidatus Dormibacteraeota bacterium]